MRTIHIDQIGTVTLKKSPRAKRVILKVDHNGQPVVVLPRYAPYIIGEKFARSNIQWLQEHVSREDKPTLSSGDRIGSAHTVVFTAGSTTVGSTVRSGTITVRHPAGIDSNSTTVQSEARKAAVRALRKEANRLLPAKLYKLAGQYGYSYTTVRVKTMRSRWGSCSSNGDIALNVWLMQIPDELQRYVLCHELAHLHNPHHKSSFWSELEHMVPDYKQLRKDLKQYKPDLLPT